MANRNEILNAEFFRRSTLTVTRDLMGQYLCRRIGDEIIRMPICEAEAYDGPDDRACHAHKGKTPRNAVMFGPPGYFYVYLCYGVHWLLNIVTGDEDYPAAILIRGAGEIFGPGRLTKHLKIDKSLDGQFCKPESGLWFEKNESLIAKKQIKRTPRIGIDYAGPIWAKKNYRFLLEL